MPVVPMQEIAKPRSLDSAAEVFLAEGRYDEAGVTLGAALAAELPAEYQRQRDPELQEVRDKVVSAIGESEAERLIRQGESFGLEAAVEQIYGWLGRD